MLDGNDSIALLNEAITAGLNSSALAVGDFNGVIAYLDVTSVSGTTPSMTVTMQDSPDGNTWYNIPSGAFTAVTAAGTQRLLLSNCGQYIRASIAVTGTTPSFTTNLQVVGQR